MAWGEEKCVFCDEVVDHQGTTTCKCPSRMTYRKEPEAPASAMHLWYHEASHTHTNWHDAIVAFERLPAQDRSIWEERALADRVRYEREKREYNEKLDLDEEILMDKEEEHEMECGNGVAQIREALQQRRCEQQWARYRRDHIRYNQTVKAPDQGIGPGYFHRFMDLPVEIRDQIYNHLFHISDWSEELRHWQLEYESADIDVVLRCTHLQPLDTRILAANRQLYVEALDVLYSSRIFTIDIARASTLPLFVKKATGTSAPRPTSKIRRWHIKLTFTDITHKDAIRSQLKAVRNVMKDCIRLDEVRFTWVGVPYYWSELEGLRKEINSMLGMFKDVRGVGRVIYTESLSEVERTNKVNMFLRSWGDVHLAYEDHRKDVKASMESPV
ncbi:MAG: hypothetical protein Q9166_004245 [cf. Caloplaca sp. 2 TL-2023]